MSRVAPSRWGTSGRSIDLKGSDKGLPYSADQDNKPLHEVTLDTFYMSPTKVTYADYDVYTQATGKDKINSTNKFEMQFRQDNVPAGVDWYQAKDYCDWLAKETSLPFSLPTGAMGIRGAFGWEVYTLRH
nr:SUMF1/EgtB/PvdO family nonheme iron enzyme [Salinicola tamaricis]